jgi:hypothetical protein
MKVRIAFSSFLLLVAGFLTAQSLTNADYAIYIKQYKAIAIKEMNLYKVPASITLAQGMIESGCGKSKLAVESKNHFGIKCQKGWTGDTYYYDDDAKNECFRKYHNVEDSYRDHSIFLSTRQRYSALFTLPITDYKGWATGLKQAGYATNPDYTNILIRLIEKNQLYLFDDSSLVKTNELTIEGTDEEDKMLEKQKNAAQKTTVTADGRLIFRKNYKMPDASDYEYSYTSDEGRKVYVNYGIPFIFVKKGDTWFSIAREFNIYAHQVYKQNDLLENDPLRFGQIIYLEPKNRKNIERHYKVKAGDSMYSISQEKCIRLPKLLKYNKMKPGDEPEPGLIMKLSR